MASYSVGGIVGFVLNKRIDIGVSAIYNVGKAKLNATIISEFYTVNDTAIYTGVVNNKSLEFNIDFKYIILKSKLSPTISAGFYFSSKFKNNAEYKYTYNNGATYVAA